MDSGLPALIAANVAFVGSHFAMSHPLRGAMVARLGNGAFQIVYSLVSAAALAWVWVAFGNSPAADMTPPGDVEWVIATLLTIPAMVLLAGSLFGNPALPAPGAERQALSEPTGVFTITRHPMMWGFALWALSHILLHWSWRTTITAAAMGTLALVGARLQDRKKEALMGEAWATWESRTSFWPQPGGFARAGALPWTLGLLFYVFFTWLHMPLGNIPAGIWRWF